MTILVAADGPMVESPVAEKFTKARWYLVVDTETLDSTVLPSTTFENHHEVIVRAAALGAEAVVTGHCGPSFYHQLLDTGMALAPAHGISVLESIQRYRRGALKVLREADLRAQLERHEGGPPVARGAAQREHRMQAFAPVTPRGRHHLQQYSGRGK